MKIFEPCPMGLLVSNPAHPSNDGSWNEFVKEALRLQAKILASNASMPKEMRMKYAPLNQ